VAIATAIIPFMPVDIATKPAHRGPLSAGKQKKSWRWWILAGIGALTAAGIGILLYMLSAGEIDRGTANGFAALVWIAGTILLGLWTVFLSPFSRWTRWWLIAVPTVALAALVGLLRIDKVDGNLHFYFTWRWTEKADFALAGQQTAAGSEPVDLTPTEHDYPGFLGARRDAYVPEVRLASDWKVQPPKLIWREPIGGGNSAFAIAGNAAITMEQRGEEEWVSCYDLPSGALRWHHAVKARHHDLIGGDGPCATPTVGDGRVYAEGGTGILRCLDGTTGQLVWQRDVLADVGTTEEEDHAAVAWGRAGSPLFVQGAGRGGQGAGEAEKSTDLVVVPGGGKRSGEICSLVAYDTRTGEIVWKGGKRQISYSSPTLVTYGGVRQIVIVNEDNITGHDPATGRVLWQAPWDGSSTAAASASQTVPIGGDRFFVSKGYSGGSAVFQVLHSGDEKWSVKLVWRNHRVLKTKLTNVVTKDGFVYGLSDGVLECVDLQNGQSKWRGDDYGHGQVMRVGDLMLVTGEWGDVALVVLDPAQYRELCRFQALEGQTWNNPALAGNLFLVRNAQQAACYEMAEE
jgi:outer membrane protein assembly factor BamB